MAGFVKDAERALFYWVKEREKIRLAREAGKPGPWSLDPAIRDWRYCNVHREHDKVTRWFAKHIREPLRDDPGVFPATVIFRHFNRINVGRALLDYNGLDTVKTINVRTLRAALKNVSPLFTTAYRIPLPNANETPALEAVIQRLKAFDKIKSWNGEGWRDYAERCRAGGASMADAFEWFQQFPGIGKFLAHQFVLDLRYTGFLERAPDRHTWAAAGPGAIYGLNFLHGRPEQTPINSEQALSEMRDVLKRVQRRKGFDDWDVATVEHVLCELAKYARVRNNPDHRLKRPFKVET